MSAVTTHVLDSSTGMPAAGVAVVLESHADGRAEGAQLWKGEGRAEGAQLWKGEGRAEGVQLGKAETDADGRVTSLGPDRLEPGTYQLRFGVSAYFAGRGEETFYPEVVVAFTVTDPDQHYHVPLLLRPFGYSTYRGS